MTTDNKNSLLGCRTGIGIFLLMVFIDKIISLYTNPVVVNSRLQLFFEYLFLLGVTLFFLHPLLKQLPRLVRKNYMRLAYPSPTINDLRKSRFEIVRNDYEEEEKKALHIIENRIQKAKSKLEKVENLTEKRFLQSFIENYKDDYLSRLIEFYEFKVDMMDDKLDPCFKDIAEIIVRDGEYDEFGTYSSYVDEYLDYDRIQKIQRQLYECGVISRKFGDNKSIVLVRSENLLQEILTCTDGHSLMSRDDKIRMNNYLQQRKQSMIGNSFASSYIHSEKENNDSYNVLCKSFQKIISSMFIWELTFIFTDNINDGDTISANSSTIKRYYNHLISNDDFNFLKPYPGKSALCFTFKQLGYKLYVYPDFVLLAHDEVSFRIYDLKDFDVLFRKVHYEETESYVSPYDAKYLGHKKTKRKIDELLAPRIYEYAILTFNPFKLNLMLSNAKATEVFFMKMQDYKCSYCGLIDPIFGISYDYYRLALKEVMPLCDFYKTILVDKKLLYSAKMFLPNQYGDAKKKLSTSFSLIF